MDGLGDSLSYRCSQVTAECAVACADGPAGVVAVCEREGTALGSVQMFQGVGYGDFSCNLNDTIATTCGCDYAFATPQCQD
eukprot:220968-Chlamydomonas_euryale.AAC.1